jgi:hypothetical protein
MSGVDSKFLSNVAKLDEDLMIALRVGEILSLESDQKDTKPTASMIP